MKAKTLIDQVPEHLEKMHDTLVELQRRLDVEMAAGLAASPGAGCNPMHVRMALQLTKATTDVGRETRAWAKKSKELAQSASLEERLEAVIDFVNDLPPSEKERVLRAFNAN